MTPRVPQGKRLGGATPPLRAILVLWLTLAGTIGAHADDELATLAKLKTAYVYNIAKFVNWQNDAKRVRLCVHPRSRLRDYLAQLNNREIGGNRVLAVVEQDSSAGSCEIYYTDDPVSTAFDQVAQISPSTAPSVLEVSDHPDTLEKGFAVQFHLEDEKLRFHFNQRVLKASSFSVSSKLLNLASRSAP